MPKRKSRLSAHEIASIKAIGAHKALADLEIEVGKLPPSERGEAVMREKVLVLIRKKAAACIEGPKEKN